MRTTWLLPVLVMLVAAPMFSCSHDDSVYSDPVAPPSPYKPLTGPRDNVLFNLQKAYTERNLDRYSELLDANFLFYFSQGLIVDDRPWDRMEEINASKNMFDPNFSKPDVDPVSKIELALAYTAGDDKWTPIPPEDPVKYAGETWYGKDVRYNLTVTAGDQRYIGRDLEALFVVREATVQGYGDSIWRIVVWRDDVGTALGVSPDYRPRTGPSEETSWGKMKALYAP